MGVDDRAFVAKQVQPGDSPFFQLDLQAAFLFLHPVQVILADFQVFLAPQDFQVGHSQVGLCLVLGRLVLGPGLGQLPEGLLSFAGRLFAEDGQLFPGVLQFDPDADKGFLVTGLAVPVGGQVLDLRVHRRPVAGQQFFEARFGDVELSGSGLYFDAVGA